MQKQRRNGRASTKTSVEDEIAHLRGFDLKGLRSRWQGVFRKPAPAHLTRHLLFAVIAYRLQADSFGDLDHATRQVLDRSDAKEAEPAMSARLARFDQKRTEITPGTVLVREWDRRSQISIEVPPAEKFDVACSQWYLISNHDAMTMEVYKDLLFTPLCHASRIDDDGAV